MPRSKSLSARIAIIDFLSSGKTDAGRLAECDDTRVLLKVLQGRDSVSDVEASGTAMRFLAAYLAWTGRHTVLTGTERMKCRPVGVLVRALRELGADIDYAGREDYPPLVVKGGGMHGGSVAMQSHVSSQFVSAILMIAPYMKEGLTLRLEGPQASKPYIDMTLELMKRYGAKAAWSSEDCIRIDYSPYQSLAMDCERDWSAASYWYEIMALADDKDAVIELEGLTEESLQGDKRVTELFEPLGVKTEDTGRGIRLSKRGEVRGRYEQDMSGTPDLVQTVVVSCCMMGRPFVLTGTESLKIKETDRGKALCAELKKMGYCITVRSDSMEWNGERVEVDRIMALDTWNDHRMAMSLAPCCLKRKDIRINHPEVVGKSYPTFWEDLKMAGFRYGKDIW